MIRYKDKVFEDYFIDPVTAVITDKDGNIQETRMDCGYAKFKGMGVHCIQAHTAYGHKEGYHVHHLDENKLNNALSNLAYVTPKEHSSYHKHFGEKNSMYGKPCSDYVKQCLSDSNSGENNFAYGKHWWTNGEKNILSKECPAEGFVRGWHHSEERKRKMSEAMKGKMAGRHLSEEHKQHIRDGVLRYNKEKAQ